MYNFVAIKDGFTITKASNFFDLFCLAVIDISKLWIYYSLFPEYHSYITFLTILFLC
jgi:hypothetical protein